MREPLPATPADTFALGEFLRSVDLTTSGLDDPLVFLWMDLDADGRIVATTGFEIVDDNALIRSVAVVPTLRGTGRGTELAQFALERAATAGANRAWLMKSALRPVLAEAWIRADRDLTISGGPAARYAGSRLRRIGSAGLRAGLDTAAAVGILPIAGRTATCSITAPAASNTAP